MADNSRTTRLVQRTLTGKAFDDSTQCVCGRICKNARGLKIHQSRIGCLSDLEQRKCTEKSGETQENHNRDLNHSVEDLQLPETEQTDEPLQANRKEPDSRTDNVTSRLERIRWPAMNDKVWIAFDEDVDTILEHIPVGVIGKKFEVMARMIYTVGKERFGIMDQGRKTSHEGRKNRRQKEIEQIRQELRSLRCRFKEASALEKIGLQQLRDQLRRRLKDLRTAERTRKAYRDKARRRAKFTANPYGFTKSILEDSKTGKLESSKENIEAYLSSVHADPLRNAPLDMHERIIPVPEPETQFQDKEPTWREIQDVVRKARSKSAPGPNGVTYKVYKACPLLLKRLWRMLRVVWRKGEVPSCWQKAEGIFAPKEDKAKDIDQFRTISLLNVEGKIFFAVLSKRLTTFVLDNKYVDTSTQKGGVPGFAGCIEHTCAISQLLREAKINKSDLTVVWLDLANAYGTVPHTLIDHALKHYHVPERMQKIIRSYYSGIQLRFTTTEFNTDWINLQKGIITGCTVSVILFVMAMNLIIRAGDRETRGPRTRSDIRLPPQRGFMDDLTVTTESHIQARWILTALEDVVTWARMAFKPRNSRVLVLRRGRVWPAVLTIQGEVIPQLVDKPIKCLGRWFDVSLGDKNNTQRVNQQMSDGLKKIEKTGLPGKFKAWIFQHGLLPRILWPLMLYEIPSSMVEKLEAMINKSLRRWFGLPPSFSSIGLYNKSGMLQLPLSSLVEEYKVSKARLVMTLRDSEDENIRRAGIEVRTGRRWSASQAVEQAESRLMHKDIVGTPCSGRQGLGTGSRQTWKTSTTKQRRDLVQSEIRLEEEEARKVKAVQMGSQGSWTRWQTTERKLTWSDIWKYQTFQLHFLIRAVYDLLPTPANLQRWGLAECATCALCGGRGTLEHILSSCSTALSQGRYRWRHDQVLREMADVIERERRKPQALTKPAHIKFVKAGTTSKERRPKRTQPCFLDGTNDWELRVDLGKKLQFPDIVHTTLVVSRPRPCGIC